MKIMFGSWKRINAFQSEVIDKQTEMINTLANPAKDYRNLIYNIVNNQDRIPDDNLYVLDNNVYYIYEHKNEFIFGETIYELDLYTYNLNASENDYENWICRSQLEFQVSGNINLLELVNIDTRFEGRNGHGSRQLKKIVDYALGHNVKKIYGQLFMRTYIGIENLKHFYVKNGFTVGKTGFHMDL